jgi:hypothetical protein
MKKKTNISVSGVQVAAFNLEPFRRFRVTCIVKKTKFGHYFANFYLGGEKVSGYYKRQSGVKLAKFIGVTLEQLNNKLFDSTATIENRKRLSRILNYPRSAA